LSLCPASTTVNRGLICRCEKFPAKIIKNRSHPRPKSRDPQIRNSRLLIHFFYLCTVSCNELSILKSPKSVDFRGTTKVTSDSLADIFSAALGYSVESAHNDWDGLYVNDPFNLATGVVAVVVEGISESPIADVKTYDLEGSSSVDSLNEFLMDVMNHQKTGFHMDLKQSKPLVTPLGDLAQETGEIRTHYLKPKTNKEDRNVLEQISYVNKLAEIVSNRNLPEDDHY
jgi:renin receptor